MRREAAQPKVYRVALGFYLVLAVAAVRWRGWRRGQLGFDRFFDSTTWWKDCAAGLGVAAVLLGGWTLAGRKFDSIGLLEQKIKEILGPMAVEEALGLAVISGFAEELFFRGAVQEAWGWLAATAIFALLHSGPGAEFRPWRPATSR
jgi:membrane protease YdiL (CAAX protease family)